ncbi:MAG TPA: FlgD immunoglobulin-like domain containing protein [bacterium]|nr:FlgD immunoglobulin-like domain containing protein [bacterium]
MAATLDTVWVATDVIGGGVACATPPYTTWRRSGAANGMAVDGNFCLRIDGETVWAGSAASDYGGINYSINQGISWISDSSAKNNGIIDNFFFGMDVDGNYMYLAAKNGVCRYNKRAPQVVLTSPQHGASLNAANVAIMGTVADYEGSLTWTLAYAPGRYPYQGTFTPIGEQGTSNVFDSLLRSWDVSSLDGDTFYTIRLRAIDNNNIDNECYAVVYKAASGAVVFTSPGAGEEVGGVVSVSVVATDSDGVAAVQWQYSLDSNEGDSGSWTNCVADSGSNPDSFAPYAFRWQTLPASGKDNMVWLRARLLDNLGFYSEWTQRVIAVNNQAVDPAVQNTVTSTDRNGSLYLPPNALGSATVVTVTRMSAVSDPPAATVTAIGIGYELYPDGTTLAKPGTLTLKWTDAEAVGFDENSFALYGWNNATSAWEKIGGTVNAASNTITAAVTGFKQYAIMEDKSGAQLAPGLSQVNAQPRVFTPSGSGYSDHCDISFTLGSPESVTIKAYGLNGRLVREIAENRGYPAGSNVVAWDGRNDDGDYAANGLYIITIEAGSSTEKKTVVLMNK